MLKPEFQEKCDTLKSIILDAIPIGEEFRVIAAVLADLQYWYTVYLCDMEEEDEPETDDGDLDVN